MIFAAFWYDGLAVPVTLLSTAILSLLSSLVLTRQSAVKKDLEETRKVRTENGSAIKELVDQLEDRLTHVVQQRDDLIETNHRLLNELVAMRSMMQDAIMPTIEEIRPIIQDLKKG